MLNDKIILTWSILVFAIFALSDQVYAMEPWQADSSFYKLLYSNYLYDSYMKSECQTYVDNKRISSLVNGNNKAIANIKKQLSRQDREELQRLAASQETRRQFDSNAKIYIHDKITKYRNSVGGMAFACGVALGNVDNAWVSARSNCL